MTIKLDAATAVAAKMTKAEAANLVRFLTLAIAETDFDTINVRVDLRQNFSDAELLISIDNNTLFGSKAIINETRIINYESVEA